VAVLRVVATIDRPPRHVDQRVGALEPGRPVTEVLRIPAFDAPRRSGRRAPEGGYLVTVAMKRPRQERADLSGASGDDDLHRLTCTSPALRDGRPGGQRQEERGVAREPQEAPAPGIAPGAPGATRAL